MKILLSVFFLFWSVTSSAGGDNNSVLLTSLDQHSDNSYLLKYRNLDKDLDISVSLEFSGFQYLLKDFLSKESFNSSIALLKKQLASRQPSRLGSFGGGPCRSKEAGVDFRSDAAQIMKEHKVEKVVYLFCEYK